MKKQYEMINEDDKYIVSINGTEHTVSKEVWEVLLRTSLARDQTIQKMISIRSAVVMCLVMMIIICVASTIILFSPYYTMGIQTIGGMGIGIGLYYILDKITQHITRKKI